MKRLLALLLLATPATAADVLTHATDCTQLTPSSAAQLCLEQDSARIFCANRGATAFAECSASGDPSWSAHCALRSTGTDLYCDDDFDGTYDQGERNLTINAPTTSGGDQTVQGDLTVAQNLIVVGGIDSAAVDRVLADATTSNAVPTAGLCYPPFLDDHAASSCGPSSAQIREFSLPENRTLTHFCAYNVGSQMDSDDVFVYRLRSASGTVYAEITVRDTGGDVNDAPDSGCVAPRVTSYAAGTPLWLYVQSVAGSPATAPVVHFEVRGR